MKVIEIILLILFLAIDFMIGYKIGYDRAISEK